MSPAALMPEVRADTAVATLDTRVKFAVLLAASLLIFVWNALALQGAMLAAMIALVLAAGLGWTTVGRLAKVLLPAFVLITLVQGLWYPFGTTPIAHLPEALPWLGGARLFTVEGVLFGLVVCCRLLVPLLAFAYLFSTSTPNEVVLALTRVRVPYKVAFLVSTTFRFVPFLLEEFNAIRDAQRLRGIDYDALRLHRRLLALGRLLVPVLINALHKAQALEIALQARGFTGAGERTQLYPGRERLSRIERGLVIGLLALFVLALVARIGFGVGARVV